MTMRNLLMRGSAVAYSPDPIIGVAGDPPATPPATPPAAPWYEGADAELIGHIQTKGWHDKPANVAALAAVAAHREAEKFVGVSADRIIKLPDATDTEGMKAVWQRLGAPADAKDYDFSTVKVGDKPVEGALADFLRGTAAALNLPKDVATALGTKLVEFQASQGTASAVEIAAKVTEEMAALDVNWGANKEANGFIAKQAAAKLGVTAEEFEALRATPGGARMIEMFRKVGAQIGEDKFVQGENPAGNGVMTREQATARKAELMKDEAWCKRYMDGGTAEGREMLALNTMIVGDDTEASRRS